MGQLNADGLYLKFGTERATAHTFGEYKTYGSLSEVEGTITLTALGTAPAIMDDTLFFPKGARIEEVEIVTQTLATSGGSAVLNIGLQKTDRATEIDYDGLVAAMPLANINVAGEKNVFRAAGSSPASASTGTGALIGTTTAFPGYITADYDTAAFTAGVIKVRVKFYKP